MMKFSKALERRIYDPRCLSVISDPVSSIPDPDPGSKKYWISYSDPQHWRRFRVNNNEDCKLNIMCGGTYLRRDGSRWLHMILMGRPFSTSKFIVSRALSAEKERKISNK